MNIRHSALPKLARCGQYIGGQGNSEAITRGLRLDAAFRQAWLTEQIPDMLPDELEAIQWAINEVKQLAWNDHVETEEKHCKIKTPGMEHIGTADAICLSQNWVADLKSGQIYDYEGQVAAYSLGLMVDNFVPEWTAHLLFCDQKKVVTHHFTFDRAKEIVTRILANVGTAPTPNEYCGWCAKSLHCKPRVESQGEVLATTDDSFSLLLNDPDRLGDFLSKCKIFEDFKDAAQKRARELLEAGEEVKGWRLQKPRSSDWVEPEVLIHYGKTILPEIIRAQGSISAKKVTELFAKHDITIPESAINTKQSAAPMVQKKS